MLNFAPCYTCEKPINLDLPAFFIVAQCEGCEEIEETYVFCCEQCRDSFTPPDFG